MLILQANNKMAPLTIVLLKPTKDMIAILVRAKVMSSTALNAQYPFDIFPIKTPTGVKYAMVNTNRKDNEAIISKSS